MSFRDCAENILTVFETVIDAESSSTRSSVPKGSTTDAESLSRMIRKIETAYQGMSRSMRTAHKRQPHLTELVTEIELVLLYLDKIRNLWECHATKAPHGYLKESNHSLARTPYDYRAGPVLSLCLAFRL